MPPAEYRKLTTGFANKVQILFNHFKMKKGLEYTSSREKRMLDIAVASSLTVVEAPTRFIVRQLIRRSNGSDLPPVFEQKRIGEGHEPFTIKKYITINPETGAPWGAWAAAFRRLGLDEVAQVANIRDGTMSATGYRPLIEGEWEEVRENLSPPMRRDWEEVPGIVSSYGIDHHIHPEPDGNEYERRVEQDIRDFREASLGHDLRLMGRFVGVAVARRLK